MKAPRLEGVKDRKRLATHSGTSSARFLRRIVNLYRPLHCVSRMLSPFFISTNQLSVPLDHAADS